MLWCTYIELVHQPISDEVVNESVHFVCVVDQRVVKVKAVDVDTLQRELTVGEDCLTVGVKRLQLIWRGREGGIQVLT